MYDIALLLIGVWVGSGFKPPHQFGRTLRIWWKRVRRRSGYEFVKSKDMFFVQFGYWWADRLPRDRMRSMRLISLSLRRARITSTQRELIKGGKWFRLVKKAGSDRSFLEIYFEGVLPLVDYLEFAVAAEWVG